MRYEVKWGIDRPVDQGRARGAALSRREAIRAGSPTARRPSLPRATAVAGVSISTLANLERRMPNAECRVPNAEMTSDELSSDERRKRAERSARESLYTSSSRRFVRTS